MTEDDLYLLLKPLAGGQVYPYVAPLGSDGQPSISPPWVIFVKSEIATLFIITSSSFSVFNNSSSYSNIIIT